MGLGVNLITYPYKTVNDALSPVGEVYCNWVAAHNPIIFKYQRWDHIIISVVFSGGNYKITCDGVTGLDFSGVTAGDMLYISTADYEGVYEILTVFSPTVVYVDMTDYIADETCGADCWGYSANHSTRANYTLRLTLNKLQPVSSVVETWTLSLNAKGNITIDVSEFCKQYLDEFSNPSHNYGIEDCVTDSTLSCYFQMDWDEWYGSPAASQDNGSNTFYAVNAVKQIRDTNGSNMLAYMGWYDGILTTWSGLTPKFLHDMTRPKFFRLDGAALPFDVSFILSQWNIYGDDKVMGFSIKAFTASGSSLGQHDENINYTKKGYVNRVTHSQEMLDATAAYCFYYIGNVNDKTFYTEQKYFDIEDVCGDIFYIRWLNPLGGYSYWCFQHEQQIEVARDEAETIEQYVSDLENSGGYRWHRNAKIGQRITCYAEQLTRDQALAMLRIGASVEWYNIEDLNGDTNASPTWVKVMVESIESDINTKAPYYNVTAKFILPDYDSQAF